MLAEAIEAQEIFISVDERLNPVLERHLRSVGISESMQKETTDEVLARYAAEARALDEE